MDQRGDHEDWRQRSGHLHVHPPPPSLIPNHADNQNRYIIPRQSGDVIVGGTADANDWYVSPSSLLLSQLTCTCREPNPRASTTKMILTRGLQLCPELLPVDKREGGTIDDIDVIEEGCGRRPTRVGGIRIEMEYTSASSRGIY